MDAQNVAETLTLNERKILKALSNPMLIGAIQRATGLQDVEINRAVMWLKNKKVVHVDEQVKDIIVLGKNGELYRKTGLPERRFLQAVQTPGTLQEISDSTKLSSQELQISLGALRQKKAIVAKRKAELEISLTPEGEKLLKQDFPEELFLKKQFPLSLSEISAKELPVLESLKRRKDIVVSSAVKVRNVFLTEFGKRVKSEMKDAQDVLEKLTPQIIKSGSYQGKSFRRYDVEASVPDIFAGKRHFVNQAVSYARQIWLELGFKEMEGPIVSTGFWNFDALFTAQDHPVREMQDTFYLKSPAKGRLPDKKLVASVKAVHEHGGNTGSLGWRYNWSPEEAEKNVLRTHTTVLSAQTLAKLKEWPAKYFSVGKCFRNEALDWSHLFEFNQSEGIVVDKDVNFKHLLGYLKIFFTKMGYPKIRFRPAYFPYTELSLEVDVFHPVQKKWLELGGAGIFRPEVVEPLLGEPVPVLAWGVGFDRVITTYYSITDLRDLYKNDIKKTREARLWLE
ncbi:phenylalanine--tRNA ligase subunit alpha [Candidatus Woesearchaeota archaeon]|nr:phenylalanine--tRNA ligase subunit alpha [Candidatus Woesearchaeota archaeon]